MRDFDWNKIPLYKETLAEFDESASQWFGDLTPHGQYTSHAKMPKASQIVEFWFRWGEFHLKCYGLNTIKDLPAFVDDLVIDLGEPFCFACRNRYAEWEFEETNLSKKYKGMKALFKHWDALSLERAHVIPLSRGGSNRLRNFVLLCRTCHRDAPDVVDSSLMLKWLQNRKPILANRKIRDWTEAYLGLDVDPFVVMWQHSEIQGKYINEFREFQYAFSTNHFDTYAMASLVACVVTFAKQKSITGQPYT
jgi:5-methylcytosine-specific restriction endonuclease McrA